MNTKNWHVCVLIPAHNEELLLERCLNSVIEACSELSTPNTFDVVLAVDSSTDKTFEIGQKILGKQGVVVTIKKNNVGYARRFAAHIALKRYKGPLSQCWLANTDADCKVPTNWLIHQLIWAKSGIQSVAGIVKVDSYAEHHPWVPSKFQQDYIINADLTHPHVHGANLGIRADAYKEVGGWNTLQTAEDHDLWNRLSLLKIPKISYSKSFVFTSGRKIGRAPHGFAGTLASYNGDSHE